MNATQIREIGEMDGAGIDMAVFLLDLDTSAHSTGASRPTEQQKTAVPPLVGYTGRFYLDVKPGFTKDYDP